MHTRLTWLFTASKTSSLSERPSPDDALNCRSSPSEPDDDINSRSVLLSVMLPSWWATGKLLLHAASSTTWNIQQQSNCCMHNYLSAIYLLLVLTTGFRPPSTTVVSADWTVFVWNRDTAVHGDLQTLICVIVARPRRCLTLSNPVPWQNWMAANLGYTLRMKTLFPGWPVMVHDTYTRRRRRLMTHYSNWLVQVNELTDNWQRRSLLSFDDCVIVVEETFDFGMFVFTVGTASLRNFFSCIKIFNVIIFWKSWLIL